MENCFGHRCAVPEVKSNKQLHVDHAKQLVIILTLS